MSVMAGASFRDFSCNPLQNACVIGPGVNLLSREDFFAAAIVSVGL
jgi:hypothetical protein